MDELFMHYFHNLSSANSPQALTGAPSLTPLGEVRPQIPNLPTSGKNPAGTHGLPCVRLYNALCRIWELEAHVAASS